MNVFISHITEESAIATCLQGWVESTLLGQGKAFVSSDGSSLPPGVKWLDVLSDQLSKTNLLLVVCSAQSLGRPWINFETGVAWSRTIPVVPLCHSGSTRATLPRPLADFQAIDLEAKGPGEQLVKALQSHFKLPSMPRLDYSAMNTEIVESIKRSLPARAPSRQNAPTKPAEPAGGSIHATQVKILELLREASGTPLELNFLAKTIGLSVDAALFHLESLEAERFVKGGYEMDERIFSLAPAGRSYMFNAGLLDS